MIIKLKHLIMEGVQEKAAEDFIKQTIKGTEFENKVYAVGGYVRDFVLGKDAKDLDIVIDYPNGGVIFADWITKKIGNYKKGSNPVIFERFLTAQFNFDGVIHNGIDLTGYKIESVAPRTEEYNDPTSRNPDVKQSDLKGDALRRDLSINALYKNISNGKIVDPSNLGLSDIDKKILRPAGDPDKVYGEDALRLLRIVRFYAKFGYTIPLPILRSIKRNASKLKNISQERIRDELNKMLLTSNPDKAIKLLKVTGLLDYVIPELKDAVGMGQNIHHSDNVFDHILKVLKGTKPILVNRIGALLHDIGKTKTREVIDNSVHFYKHEDVGADMAKEIMSRLKYPNDIIEPVVVSVKNHMRLKSAGKEGDLTSDKSLKKFVVDVGEHLENILDIIHSDNIAHSPESSMPNQIPNIIKRIDILKSTIPKKQEKLPVTGDDLIQMGLKPGKIYKEILDLVRDKQLENSNTTKNEYLDMIKKYLESIKK